MRRMFLILPPFLLATMFLVFAGCGSPDDFGKPKLAKPTDGTGDGGSTGDPTKVGLTPIKGTGVATLKGKITITGEEPNYEQMTEKLVAGMVQDRSVCLMGSSLEKSQYAWVVDEKSKGVNNVFVWMRPVDDKKEFFDVTEAVKEGKGFDKTKTVDQPHCAFVPHALTLFPRYIDPANPSTNFRLTGDKGPPVTGQQFLVKNTGTINHNTKTDGDQVRMKAINQTISSGGQIAITDIYPSYKSPVQVGCNVHPWMQCWVWAFDHPYSAVTGAKVGDKELPYGEYRIEGIPAGVKLRVVAWHEDAKFLNGGEKGEEITLKEGDNTKDFTISYKK